MFKLNAEKMFYDSADGMAVVINYSTGVYYAFNRLASALFEALNQGADPETLAAALTAAAGAPADIQSSFQAFLAKLQEKEIFTASPEPFAAVDFTVTEDLLADGWELNVDEFNEVQDLIMADPIHDTDDAAGWPVLEKK